MLKPKPELRERLIELNDYQVHGYISHLAATIEREFPEQAASVVNVHEWCKTMLLRGRSIPMKWAMTMVRVTEGDYKMPRDKARALLPRYFKEEV